MDSADLLQLLPPALLAPIVSELSSVALTAGPPALAWQPNVSTNDVPTFAKLAVHVLRVCAMRSLVSLLGSGVAVEAALTTPDCVPRLIALAEMPTQSKPVSAVEDLCQLSVRLID